MINYPDDIKDIIGKKLIWEQPNHPSDKHVYLIKVKHQNNDTYYYADDLTSNQTELIIEVGPVSAQYWTILYDKPLLVSVNRLELIFHE